MIVKLDAYSTTTITGSPAWTTNNLTVAEPSQQQNGYDISIPFQFLRSSPASVFTTLDESSPDFPGQGWGGKSSGSRPQSFRVTIIVPFLGSAGDAYFDIGRLWIGNALRPECGTPGPRFGIVDPSDLKISRDAQAFAQYFDRSRNMYLTFPAMTEMEALGVGVTNYYNYGPQGNFSKYTANNWTQAMYTLGLSRECIAWAIDAPDNGSINHQMLVQRAMMYGHITSWDYLQYAQARKPTRDGNDTPGPATSRRRWSGGLTIQEER
jgi:hypothetical protein